MYKFILVISIGVVLLSAGCSKPLETTSSPSFAEEEVESQNPTYTVPAEKSNEIDFSLLNSKYKFSANLPQEFKAEYIPTSDSINIYNPDFSGNSSLEKSVIFIRNFKANDFLTLSTVNILSSNKSSVQGRPAVQYEIKKKKDVPNFPNQPTWRNEQHKLIDIRYSSSNPSTFFVFSYNPNLPEPEFSSFVDSLEFIDE